MTRNKRAIALAATLMLLALAPAAARAAFTPGSAGVGDPFFPLQGNGGYDASSYDLDLAYQPGSQRLRATATIVAVATQDLSQFDLDYRGPTIDALSVDGAPAGFKRRGQELVVTPAAGITAATGFTVEVRYHGRATNIKDPDGALDGWIHTDDGVAALGEPQGAPTWFPCNDTPTDKALYRISIRVPKRLKAISNGRLASHEPDGTWNWVSDEPMASYLATVTIGRFQVERGRAGGVPSYVAVDPREARKSRRPLRATPRIMRLFDRLFGPYPFSQVGAIVDHAQKIGYALETQTRPVYDQAPNARLIAHELAHMWFGDSVSVTTWPDIWLTKASPHGPSGATRKQSATPPPRSACGGSSASQPPRSISGTRHRRRCASPRSCSPPRSTSAAGWPWRRCASESATRRSTPRCAPGRRPTATAMRPSRTSPRSPSSSRTRTSTPSSVATCTSAASRSDD